MLTRDVALFLGSAGGVSGKGSGASPSQDAVNLVRWTLARGLLDPGSDRVTAVHCVELVPLASQTLVTHELVTPTEFPDWMPPALAHAFGRFVARGGGRGAAAALLESPLAPAEALVRFVSGELHGAAEGRHSAQLLAFRSERASATLTDLGGAGGATTRRRSHDRGEPEPFLVDLWPAETVVPSRRRRGDENVPAFDLVLVGTSDEGFGRGALRRAVLGSVSRRVLERSPAPVLVVRGRDARRTSGFANDAAFAPAVRERAPARPARALDASSSAGKEKGGALASFPGTWRMLVRDLETATETERGIIVVPVTEPSDRRGRDETTETDVASAAESSALAFPFSSRASPSNARVSPITGNVLCIAHDGGEDGVALVRWTLRTVLRSSDRAVVIVHVVPGSAPEALAAAFEPELRRPVADALLQSDEDVARAIAAFRHEEPPPATLPASSVLVVDSWKAPRRDAETENERFAPRRSERRVGLGPFLSPGSAEGEVKEKWGLGALLRIASERSADVLVVGSRRLKSRLVAGGAARTCARLAPCAVLAVPADELGPLRRRG